MKLYLKHLLVRTPLEGPAKALQRILGLHRDLRHPELREVYAEPRCISKALARILRKDSNCIDVGCHIGSMLSVIVKLAPEGTHWAFEPIPKKARWLRRKFPDVTIREVALGNESSTVVFHENLARSGFSGIGRQAKTGERVAEYAVRQESLDSVLTSEHKVDFIKIDVEGWELPVLKGAEETVATYSPVLLFECAPRRSRSIGWEAVDLYDYVTLRLGYSIYTPRGFLEGEDFLSRDAFLATQIYPFKAFNFFAMPKP